MVRSINEPQTPAHTQHSDGTMRDEEGKPVAKKEDHPALHQHAEHHDDGGDDDRHGRRRKK